MKTFRINKEEALSHDNVEKAFLKPSLGKRERPDVKAVLDNLEEEIAKLQLILENGEYKPDHHIPVKINERNYQKERTIIKPNYKYEQVVHHIIVQALRPGIETGMYEYVLGSIPGRGPHRGAKKIEHWIRTDITNTKYVLKMDIRHFFQSVDHDVLKDWIKRKFKDSDTIELAFLIIDAVEEGLPLGFYTSQWFANFLLQPLDHYIKEQLHVKYMTRYMDDIVCFGRNKKKLHQAREGISNYLEENFHLQLKRNWQMFRFEYTSEEYAIMCNSLKELESLGKELESLRIRHTVKMYRGKRKIFLKEASLGKKSDLFNKLIKKYRANVEVLKMVHGRPLDYMGFEFHRDRTLIRESTMYRLTRKARQVSRQGHINPKDAMALLSRMGVLKHTDTYAMYEERIKPITDVKKLKKIVSKETRRKANVNSNLSEKRRNTGAEACGAGQNFQPINSLSQEGHCSDNKN